MTDTPTNAELVASLVRLLTVEKRAADVYAGPPQVDGICDVDGSPLGQRADDEESTVRARMAQQLPPLAEVVEHYRSAGILASVDGRQSIEDVTRDVLAAADRAREGV